MEFKILENKVLCVEEFFTPYELGTVEQGLSSSESPLSPPIREPMSSSIGPTWINCTPIANSRSSCRQCKPAADSGQAIFHDW